MSTTTLTITTELLREWQACKDGYSWFVSKFPQGGAYEDVQSALKADKRADDLRWLTDRMFESLLKTPSLTALAVKGFQADAPDVEVASVNAEDAPAHDQDYAQIGSSGDAARIGSSGYYAQIGSSGHSAQINAEGARAVIASAGLNARVRAGEEGAVAVAYHDGNRIRFAVGYVGENLKALTWYSVNDAGEFVEVSE